MRDRKKVSLRVAKEQASHSVVWSHKILHTLGYKPLKTEHGCPSGGEINIVHNMHKSHPYGFSTYRDTQKKTEKMKVQQNPSLLGFLAGMNERIR